MKRLFSTFFISFILYLSLYGQWYTKKYGVTDIRDLTDIQLRTYLSESKYLARTGGGCIVFGGLMIVVTKTTYKNGLPDDATLAENLLGSRFMKALLNIAGLGLIGGGVIAGEIGLRRSGIFKEELNERKLTGTSLNLRPVVLNDNNGFLYPGLSFSIQF